MSSDCTIDSSLIRTGTHPLGCLRGQIGMLEGLLQAVTRNLQYPKEKKELISKNIHTKFLKLVQYKMI